MRSRSCGRMPTPRSSTVSRSELASWIRPTRMGAGRAALASAALRIRFTSRSYKALGSPFKYNVSSVESNSSGSFFSFKTRLSRVQHERPQHLRAGLASPPLADLHDGDTPAPQGGVDVQLRGVVRGGGFARCLRFQLGAGRHFPHGNGAAPERDARLAQDLASAFDERLPLRHGGSHPHTLSLAARRSRGRRSQERSVNRWGALYICDKLHGPSSNRAV